MASENYLSPSRIFLMYFIQSSGDALASASPDLQNWGVSLSVNDNAFSKFCVYLCGVLLVYPLNPAFHTQRGTGGFSAIIA